MFAAYYNMSAANGAAARKQVASTRSAEITRKEMQDTMRTMTDVIKAKDEQVADAIRAIRAKDEQMRAKDEQVADAMKAMQEYMRTIEAKDHEIAALRRTEPRGPNAPAIADIAL